MAGMNDQVHFYADSELKASIRKKAREKCETDSDFCRRKVKEGIEIDNFSQVIDLIADKFTIKFTERIVQELNRQLKREKKQKSTR